MRITVNDGQAVNHDGRQYQAGESLDVEDRLAAKWLERLHVMPAKPPAKAAKAAKAAKKTAKKTK